MGSRCSAGVCGLRAGKLSQAEDAKSSKPENQPDLSSILLTLATNFLLYVVLIVVFGGKSLGISHGDIFLLLSMLSLSVSLLFIRKLTQSMPAYDITILTTLIGTVLMAPAAGVEAALGHLHVSHHAGFWLVVTCAAIFGQGLAGFWWNRSISEVGASTSSMFMNIPPFVAIVVAYFLLGDPIRFAQIGGGILILLGVALSNVKANGGRAGTVSSSR